MPRPIQSCLLLVAIFLSFRVLWGGGAVIRPPPAVRRWLRPPAVRGLKSDYFILLRMFNDQLINEAWCTRSASPGASSQYTS